MSFLFFCGETYGACQSQAGEEAEGGKLITMAHAIKSCWEKKGEQIKAAVAQRLDFGCHTVL